MSGSQIGGVIGGVVGFIWFGGNWQAGYMIGSAIGGAIDPTEVKGPRIGDGQSQSSAEGVPIAWILGTAGFVQGNVVDKGPRREVKKKDDGKGSGTVQVTYEAHQDFTIMICESCELRDSLMVGVLIVRRNGKIVYDMRAESNFAAENAKFLRNHTFYDGNESQLTDPTEESWPTNGVGNTPYYKGVYRMVARDINLSEFGDAIPTYEFVMVGAGDVVERSDEYLLQPPLAGFIDAHWPLEDPERFYTLTGYMPQTTGSTIVFSADTVNEIIAYFSSYNYAAGGGGSRSPIHYCGYSSTSEVNPSTTTGLGMNISTRGVDNAVAQPSVGNNFAVVLVYNDNAPGFAHAGVLNTGFCGIASGEFVQSRRGKVSGKFPSLPNGQYTLDELCGGGGNMYGTFPLCIHVVRKGVADSPGSGDPCVLGVPTLLPDAPGFVQDCDGDVFPAPTYSPVTGTFRALQSAVVAFDGTSWMYTKFPIGPVMLASDPNNNQAFWESAYAAAVADGAISPGKVYPTDYPVAASSAYKAEIITSSIETDELSVAQAITRICKRATVSDADLVFHDFTETLIGYPIRDLYDGTECLRPLLFAFSKFGSEYNGKINFHAHGLPIDLVIDPDDMIDNGDAVDRDTRDQKIEYPRKIGVGYIDYTQNYEARPQWAYAINPDVLAVGEAYTQTSVVMGPDQAAKLADITFKVSEARSEGFREFSLPYAQSSVYLRLVAGMPLALDGKRWVVEKVMLEDGELQIKALYDRQTAFVSVATGVPGPAPTPPPSSLSGVTLFAAMNIPAGRDQDDRIGVYLAVAGLLESWHGCAIQMSSDDQASWQTVVDSATQQSPIGILSEELPQASASGDDVTNVLRVSVHGGELNSVTREQYLNEQNGAAIVRPDGTAELIQFQDAHEVSAGNYELTTLARGRLATIPELHAAGTRFVEMSAAYFVEIPSSLIGRTLHFRPVGFNTIPEDNAVYSIVFAPAYSQTEWMPEYLDGRYSGGAFIATVVPRHRFGTDVNPIASGNFRGYQWTATDGTVTQVIETDINTPSVVINLADFPGTVSLSVAMLNRITGPGPSTASITI